MEQTILSHLQIQYKIERIAYQIYEANVYEDEIIIAGINGGGIHFAEKIVKTLKKITEAKISLCKVMMDKKNPLTSGVTTSMDEKDFQG